MRYKRIFFIVLTITAGLILLFFLLNIYVKEKIETELSRLDPPLTYEKLDLNIFLNDLSLTKVNTRQKTFSLSSKKASLDGLSYYGFLFKDLIKIKKIRLEEPSIRYIPRDSVTNDTTQKRHIEVGTLLLKNGNFSRAKSDTSAADLFISFPEVELNGLDNSGDLKLESYKLRLDSLYLKMNAEHYIEVGNTEAEDGKVKLTDFRIVPVDTKKEFDRKIPYEKDRISLKVNEINLENFIIDEINDTLFLEQSKMTISQAGLEIYRNKQVKDDVRKKVLYNELLREAPVKIHFEEVMIENSEIIYQERVQEGQKPAVIRFADVTAEIRHLNNLNSKEIPQPKITARANFMRGTPVEFTWTFPVFDANNSFAISGNFGALKGESLDPFLVPAMDLRARGEINSIKFDFQGNEDRMAGSFIMDYENFQVELLKENGKEKKNFLSTIANLFVENKPEAGTEDKRIEVKRDKQRSFWNYVWLGLRQGFQNTLSQL